MKKIWFERPMLPQFAPMLNGIAEAIGPASSPPDEPLQQLAEADAIMASAFKYDAAFMDKAPKAKIIARTGIGYDNVDVEAATARGIAVCNTPEGPTISTAEHTIMLMLAVAKRLKEAERRLRAGEGRIYASHNGLELQGLTLGLVGFGRIARRVALVAQALGMRVSTYDPFVLQADAEAHKVRFCESLAVLLGDADVVSLHLPLTEDTRRLFSTEQFAQMKQGAIFINASRGPLVDEAALAKALESGHLFGAGLDVTDPEPPHLENPLLQMENVVVTPHVASATTASKARIFEMALVQVLQVFRGERPTYLVNSEVWKA